MLLISRYFDLRVAVNDADQKQYFVHGLYCEEVVEPFKEFLNFLEEHPREFVILDFQHFYNFTPEHHEQLIDCILNFFGRKIVRRGSGDSDLSQVSLSSAFEHGQQIIVVYRNSPTTSGVFFCPCDFPTPWPDSTNINDLKKYLEQRIQYRSCMQGFITQCVITPDANYIVPRFYSSLRRSCARKVESGMSDWIKNQKPGVFRDGEEPTVNILLADFTDILDSNFTRNVIDLNMKLGNAETDNDIK